MSMHAEHAFRSQRENAPYVPVYSRHRPVLVRVDLGWRESPQVGERPTRVREPIPTSERAENAAMLVPPEHSRDAWPCVDCHARFEQRTRNHVRCVACGVARRKARNKSGRKRNTGPRHVGRRRVA